MKDLRNLKGAKELNKKEQKVIKGGRDACGQYLKECPEGYWCNGYYCVPEMPDLP